MFFSFNLSIVTTCFLRFFTFPNPSQGGECLTEASQGTAGRGVTMQCLVSCNSRGKDKETPSLF